MDSLCPCISTACVDNAYSCDPRVKQFKEQEKAEKEAKKKAKKEAARQEALERERVRFSKYDTDSITCILLVALQLSFYLAKKA